MSNYRLQDKDADKRLAELLRDNDCTSLEREIALIRLAIQRAADNNHDALLATLATTLARLTSQHQQRAFQAGELLCRAAVMAIGARIVEILLDEFRGVDEWETRLERAANRIGTVIDEAGNPSDSV